MPNNNTEAHPEQPPTNNKIPKFKKSTIRNIDLEQ